MFGTECRLLKIKKLFQININCILINEFTRKTLLVHLFLNISKENSSNLWSFNLRRHNLWLKYSKIQYSLDSRNVCFRNWYSYRFEDKKFEMLQVQNYKRGVHNYIVRVHIRGKLISFNFKNRLLLV